MHGDGRYVVVSERKCKIKITMHLPTADGNDSLLQGRIMVRRMNASVHRLFNDIRDDKEA